MPTHISIDRVTCRLSFTQLTQAQKFLKSGAICSERLHQTFQKSSITTESLSLYLPSLVINLDNINPYFFSEQFYSRLLQELNVLFTATLQNNINQIALKGSEGVFIPFHQQNLSGESHTQADEIFQLAIRCMHPLPLRQLMQNKSAFQRQVLVKQLHLPVINATQDAMTARDIGEVSESQLFIMALIWLQNSSQGEHWLKEQRPDRALLQRVAQTIEANEIAVELVEEVFREKTPASHWQTLLLQNISAATQRRVRSETVFKKSAKRTLLKSPATEEKLRSQTSKKEKSALVAGNVGLFLLWPMLPQLFSLLKFTDEQQFITKESRRQAAICLDWLAWGNQDITEERQTANFLLCGIPLPRAELVPEPPTVEQQSTIDNWLSAVSKQLPAWQKLSLTDIRQLFLQRSGEIIYDRTQTRVVIHAEPWDVLLRDLPWPLTLATFPWLTSPLYLEWPSVQPYG
ncbi:contractile injection system tape measure protein [Erwinia oleae]|uniref:contractile injection system tape measure protein n=1 Tax=Erwinia oleae TaxID=796334 RepID=UPI0005504EB7|nr:contractile injection system tape measure protein [Erwinia oleae]